MTTPLFYWSFLALCSVFILARGGAPERVGILIAIVASVLSTASVTRDLATRFSSLEAGVFIIDLVTLAAFLALVAWADRFWPLWVAGMHIVSVVTHAAVMIDASVLPRVYAFTEALWCYPILVAMVIGTIRHRRRLALYGIDRSWAPFFARSMRPAPRRGPTG
ncbi:MAG: hypothetical protein QOH47_981 [Sphingomonadales bacterium]|jgi:hypothetical protein|nr:hypothetical protein [Sphingomonadales bacterium]